MLGILGAAAGVLYGAVTDGAHPIDRAQQLFNATDYQAVVSLLHDAKDARGLELEGRSYLALLEHKKATETLEKAVALDPDNSMLHTWLARACGHRAETSFAMTAIHYANRTREEFERAVELDPSNKHALGDLLDFYVEAPGMVGGGIAKAEALLPRIEKVDPVGAELGKARIAEHEKQLEKAEGHLHRAIELVSGQKESRAKLHSDLAKFLAHHGRYDESEKAFEAARKDAPNSRRIDFDRAETYLHTRHNKAEARELLKKYIAADNLTPDDPSRAEAAHLLKKAEGN